MYLLTQDDLSENLYTKRDRRTVHFHVFGPEFRGVYFERK